MSTPAIVVRRASGLVTVQDAGRPGYMHLGIPPGGPLAPSRCARANRAVGNPHGAAALEIVGVLVIEAVRDVRVSVDGEPAIALSAGATFKVASTHERRVRYIAVAGGIDVPIVFGGRGTLLVAGLGGFEGRALRANDALALGSADSDAGLVGEDDARESPRDDAVRVVAGPDRDAFAPDAFAALERSTFVVSVASDRVGTRLEGTRVDTLPIAPGARRPSTPMIRGAMQVPPDGAPIVLGPDHPTTGGYPIVAIVLEADVERVVAAPIGAPIRFRIVR